MVSQQSGLSDAFVEKQRARLEAMQRQILGGEENTVGRERGQLDEQGSEAEESEDEAQRLEQFASSQALRGVNVQRIADIQRALAKIAEGTYGLSDESGEPIPQARLEVMPEAILTVGEQTRREAGK
ncbi:TraR/DksA family transcriptional regulator [Paraburkholderia sp.]|uniref:TraR/DksA family transcriptional regulator n=1 Tax=Paraburkholderia sp. TaxID=1926495 RepID=UPI0039E3337E